MKITSLLLLTSFLSTPLMASGNKEAPEADPRLISKSFKDGEFVDGTSKQNNALKTALEKAARKAAKKARALEAMKNSPCKVTEEEKALINQTLTERRAATTSSPTAARPPRHPGISTAEAQVIDDLVGHLFESREE